MHAQTSLLYLYLYLIFRLAQKDKPLNRECYSPHKITRAVSVNALIYTINAHAINAIQYFNAINATSKKKNAFIWIGHEVMTGSEAEKRWGEDWELHQAP